MRKYCVGIDNGVSGSIGIVRSEGRGRYLKTPTIRSLSYQKSKERYIGRLDFDKFYSLLKSIKEKCNGDSNKMIILMERPFVNGLMFQASISAVRCLEAQLIAIERLKIPYIYCDSKEWQRELLPKGIKEKEKLKEASLQIGKRLFPLIDFDDFKDADGILIAEYCRRKKL